MALGRAASPGSWGWRGNAAVAVFFPWFGGVLSPNPIVSSLTYRKALRRGAEAWAVWGVAKVAVKGRGRVGAVVRGAGPGPSALGRAESTAAAGD